MEEKSCENCLFWGGNAICVCPDPCDLRNKWKPKESDPNGLKNSEPGAKTDNGKVCFSLIPRGPLYLLAKLYTTGAIKYSRFGWTKVEDGEVRYGEALQRHLNEYLCGEWLDSDTKVPHLIAVAWNSFAIVYFRGRDGISEGVKKIFDMNKREG